MRNRGGACREYNKSQAFLTSSVHGHPNPDANVKSLSDQHQSARSLLKRILTKNNKRSACETEEPAGALFTEVASRKSVFASELYKLLGEGKIILGADSSR